MAESSTHREIGDYIINTDLKECLGRTPKVVVHPGIHKVSKKKVAGKLFVWNRDYPWDVVDREVENMRAIPDHENVLKLVDYVKIQVGEFMELWLILEHCQHGNLKKFAKTRNLSLPQKIDLMLQSAKGVQHIHHLEKPMIHRDLKPDNLLLTGNPLHPLVKVADLGESTYFQGSNEHSLRYMTATGTPYYQAPELFSDKESNRPAQNKAVDTFALGVSFLHLLHAEKDVDSDPITVGNKVLGLHMHQNPNSDVRELLTKPGDSNEVKQVKNLICGMLVGDPKRRILIDEVVERLRELRTSLGVKVLLAIDDVWETPIIYIDRDLQDRTKTSILSRKSPVKVDPQQATVTTDPPTTNAGMRMEHAERVTSSTLDVLDELAQIHVGGDMDGRLLTAGRNVPTHWDDTRSAIVLVKKQQTFDLNKEFFNGQLRKHGIRGSVQSVHIPLKIHLEKKYDENQLETGIVVFEDHQTCGTFIKKFTENAFPLNMATTDRTSGIMPASEMTYSRPIPISMATQPSGTDCWSESTTRTDSYSEAGKALREASSGESCPICLEEIFQPKVLPCKHAFCTDCIDQAFSKTKPACPVCGTIFGVMKGNQPPGEMKTRTEYSSRLPGYPRCGVIVIDYHISDGIQTDEHPNPGRWFNGLRRAAYLPDNSEGRKVERLLRKAFDARLIFTIGRSVTTGRENRVTWNDIPHKTNTEGGPAKFGYPDAGYLQRVQEELAAKGIKE